MQGNYRAKSVCRPGLIHDCGTADEASARTFLCGRCLERVFVCSHCDRGQIYCAGGCAQAARRVAQREAGRRYQESRDGRFAHAERNRRYRARRKIVTHQGTPPPAMDGLVEPDRTAAASGHHLPTCVEKAFHCNWCGRPCSAFVRQGALRRRRRVPRRQSRHDRRGPDRRDNRPRS